GCPVLLAAGWADPAFAAMMLRTLERLEVPRLGIFGPWAHRYPHLGIPGPAIDYLGETLRWLDHWLKGRDSQIMAEPRLRAWLASDFAVAAAPQDRAGRWVGPEEWPDPLQVRRGLLLPPQGDAPGAPPAAEAAQRARR